LIRKTINNPYQNIPSYEIKYYLFNHQVIDTRENFTLQDKFRDENKYTRIQQENLS